MKRQGIKHQLDGLIALLLFGVFAVCVLIVLLTGADAYRRLTERDQNNYQTRTLVQYIAARVRQADGADRISIEDFGGVQALRLADEDGAYITRVYCYDGWLMELYSGADSEMDPQDGERILESGGLELSMEDGLLYVTVRDAQRLLPNSLLLSLRSGEEGIA